jgi:hypothetical protein
MAAGASYYGINMLFAPPAAKPVPAAAADLPVVAPTVHALPPASAAVPAGAKTQALTTTESALPPGTDVPAGSGLLEVQVPDGTAIRVDGEYLGMGPGRRVPLTPGPHQLALGEGAPQSVSVKAGQRTLVVAATAAAAPAGSP